MSIPRFPSTTRILVRLVPLLLAAAPAAAQRNQAGVDTLVTPARPGSPACLPGDTVRPARTEGARSRTRVVLLGTGHPIPEPDRSGPAVAIVVDANVYLVDAGVGLVRQASAAAAAGQPALSAPALQKVFVTHLHSDHTMGMPDVMFTPWIVGRRQPLQAWGPAGTRAMAERLMLAWEEDLEVRLHAESAGEGGADGLGMEVCEIPEAVSSAVVFRDRLVTVTAFAVEHGSWNQADPVTRNRAFAYRFDTPDLSVVVSGDTGPAPEAFARACGGCDVLVHEVYAMKNRAPLPQDRKDYDAAYHTSTLELARSVAPAADPGLLVLYHVGVMPGVADADVLREMAGYRGRVCLGRDLDVYARGALSPCPAR
ncbi:MAG TPA: MBL fold metallo-hydrolase [Longimicrobium sp.]|nr:MBL fold metallo-hydrolase [Longimicrobium sp.]